MAQRTEPAQNPALTKRALVTTAASIAGASVLLAACQAGGKQEGPRLTTENIELRHTYWGSPEEGELWVTFDDESTRRHPNIKIVSEHIPSEYENKVAAMIAGGTAPEIMNIQDEPFPSFADRGAYHDLTSLVQRDRGQIKLDDFWPSWLEMFRWDEKLQRTNVSSGKIYALPWDGGNILWFYNKDVFDNAGVSYPKANWTWEEFVDACQRLTQRDSSGVATRVAFSNPGDVYNMPFVWTLSKEYVYLDKDYKRSLFDSSGSRFAHEQIWRLLWEWQVVRTSQDFQGEQRLFENGKIAMTITGPWFFPDLRRWQNQTGWDRWDIAPMWSYQGYRQTRQSPDGMAIGPDVKHVEEAWDYIKFVVSDDGQRRISRLGRGMPARKSIAYSEDYVRPDTPQDEKVFADAMEYSGYQPVTKYWGEMWRIIRTHYNTMFDPGQKAKPGNFLGIIAEDITRLLESGQLPAGYQ